MFFLLSCGDNGLNCCDPLISDLMNLYAINEWTCNGGDGVMLLCVILLFVGCAWSVKWKFFNSYIGEVLIEWLFRLSVIVSMNECMLLMMVGAVILLHGRLSLFVVLEVLNACFSIGASVEF